MPDRPATTRRRWLVRGLIAAFYIGMAWILFSIGKSIDWPDVLAALRDLPGRTLAIAGAFSATTYMLYTGFELLAARHLRLPLRARLVAPIGFASYALNLNVGAILGALGARLRLYAACAVPTPDVLRVVAFNLLTNWSGYVLVLGLALIALWSDVPERWRIASVLLRAGGATLVIALALYLWACFRARRRVWTLRGQELALPSGPVALMQLALGAPAWIAAAVSLHVLIGGAGFDLVLVTLLASAVAGLVVRVPAGLGVIEAVFIASLGAVVGNARLLAALLAYRCIHYLVPLAAGVLTFTALELSSRLRRVRSPD